MVVSTFRSISIPFFAIPRGYRLGDRDYLWSRPLVFKYRNRPFKFIFSSPPFDSPGSTDYTTMLLIPGSNQKLPRVFFDSSDR